MNVVNSENLEDTLELLDSQEKLLEAQLIFVRQQKKYLGKVKNTGDEVSTLLDPLNLLSWRK